MDCDVVLGALFFDLVELELVAFGIHVQLVFAIWDGVIIRVVWHAIEQLEVMVCET